mmetsp:Transcript_12319/g.22167  ORF Transcript_12319/g.22167 Transcript_12319/m.22167 type:complete len:280 (-) Transcript_12319:1032-1871(-)
MARRAPGSQTDSLSESPPLKLAHSIQSPGCCLHRAQRKAVPMQKRDHHCPLHLHPCPSGQSKASLLDPHSPRLRPRIAVRIGQPPAPRASNLEDGHQHVQPPCPDSGLQESRLGLLGSLGSRAARGVLSLPGEGAQRPTRQHCFPQQGQLLPPASACGALPPPALLPPLLLPAPAIPACSQQPALRAEAPLPAERPLSLPVLEQQDLWNEAPSDPFEVGASATAGISPLVMALHQQKPQRTFLMPEAAPKALARSSHPGMPRMQHQQILQILCGRRRQL